MRRSTITRAVRHLLIVNGSVDDDVGDAAILLERRHLTHQRHGLPPHASDAAQRIASKGAVVRKFAGVPVIASDTPSLREILEDKENALLFDMNDPLAFDEALEVLCRDESLRTRLGKAARQTIFNQSLTWDEKARRVEEIGREVLSYTGR